MGKEPVSYEPRRPVPWNAVHLFLVVLILMCTTYVTVPIVFWAMGVELQADPNTDLRANLAQQVTSCIAFPLAMVLSILMLRLTTGATAADLGWNPRRLLSDVRLGVLAFVAIVPVVFAIQAALAKVLDWESSHPLVKLTEEHPTVLVRTLVGLAAIVVAPMVEEFGFRILLQGWFEAAVSSLRLRRRQIALAEAAVNDVTVPPVIRPDSDNPYQSPVVTNAIATDGDLTMEIASIPPWPQRLWPIAATRLDLCINALGTRLRSGAAVFLSLGTRLRLSTVPSHRAQPRGSLSAERDQPDHSLDGGRLERLRRVDAMRKILRCIRRLARRPVAEFRRRGDVPRAHYIREQRERQTRLNESREYEKVSGDFARQRRQYFSALTAICIECHPETPSSVRRPR